MGIKQMENGKMKGRMMLWIVLMAVLISTVGIRVAHASTDYVNTGGLPALNIDLLNQDPDPARAGDTVVLRFKAENPGGATVHNLTVEMLQDYPFTIADGSPVQNLGDINALLVENNYQTFYYTVKIDKDNIQSQREIRLKYGFDGGPQSTESFIVNIANTEFAQIIYIDKAQLNPGQETEMKFTINNVGSAPLQNLVFSWNEATGAVRSVYSGDTKYVKYLDAGDSVELSYTVIADVNANPGLYTLDLNLEAESLNNASPIQISTKAGVMIGGETDFDVAFSESTGGQTSLSVSNTGNNPAQSVSVTIPSQQNFRVSGSNSAIIGNLNKGDYTLVSFQIASASSGNFSGNGTGGRQFPSQGMNNTERRFGGNDTFGTSGNASNNPSNLQVIVYYTDTTGQRRSVEKSVPIQFRSLSSTSGTATGNNFGNRSQPSSSFIGSTTFYIIVAVVVIGAGIFIYRKKKIAKKEKMILSERKR